ncbi:hypothetical protein GSF04_10525 [Pseudoalteromonas sp. A22]|uniref:hypothetical protein n=1 Tax=Pseudoalteromonas sp. A22 TaxID=327511 RepID=UPI001BAA32D5|nr:hypothetical protein [Pseudoalteromonas sp. A22]QUI62912.1 hypothetical protein GSF04_10525 [Pseudoalteromonas sp. A22]
MRLGLTIAVATITLLTGCGGSSTDSQDQAPPPKTVTPPPTPTENKLNITALDQNNHVYSSDLGYTTTLERVFNLKDNKLLVLGETSSVEELGNKEGFYAITNLDGQTYQYEQTQEGFVDACVFDSGEYVIGRFKREDTDQFSVQLERYDGSGTLLQNAEMKALSMDVKYDIPADRSAWLKKPFTIIPTDNPLSEIPYTQTSITWWRFNNVKFSCHDNNLYVSYNNGGQKIAKYDVNLQLKWQKLIDIRYWANSSRASEAIEMALSENGFLYTVQNISTDAIPAYNHKFSTNHAIPDNTEQSAMHMIVKTFNVDGEQLNEQFISDTDSSLVEDVQVHQDSVFVGVSARRSKTGKTRYSSEWDIGLVKVYHSEKAAERYWYDLDKEDVLRGLKISNGTLFVYGHTGGVQVDTNSWVEHSKAFIGKINLENLADIAFETTSTARSASFQDLTIQNGVLSAVGLENAPMTHSTDISMAGLFIKKTLND